ncbi:DDE-type integrase/transposase/recombinase [Streptomyces chartreusis]
MRQAGLRLRRKHRTTIPDPAAAKAANLIGRDFTAAVVNTKYVDDITYLPLVGGKFLYLATVIDLASRRLVGWAIADHTLASRPRGWKTPAEASNEQLQLLQQTGVATTG